MVNSLADIMQQAGTLSQNNVNTKLRSHYTCQVGNLNRMVQDILTIAGTIFQAAQQLNQFGVQTMHSDSKGSLFAGFLNLLLNLFLCLFNHFLNAGRMNTTIINQFFQSDTGNLAAYRIKAGNNNSLRSIIDNQINAGQGFQSTDVTAFTTDNAALHFIVRQAYYGNGGFRYMVCCTTLNCQGDNFSCLAVSLILSLLLQILNHHSRFVLNLVLEGLQQLLLCFVTGQSGNTLQFNLTFFQHCLSLLLSSVQALFLGSQLFFLAFEGFDFTVQIFFFLQQTTLLTLQVVTSVFIFTLHFGTQTMDFFFSLHHDFFAFCFAGLLRILYNTDSLLFCSSNFTFSNIFANQITYCTAGQTNNNSCTDNF